MTILRWLIAAVLSYFIFTETGFITAIALFILFVFNESQIVTNKKVLENEKLLLKDLGNVMGFINKFCPYHLARSLHGGDKTGQVRPDERDKKAAEAS